MNSFNRRDFVLGSTALGLVLAARSGLAANPDRQPVYQAADRLHDEGVQRLQDWVRNPTIAAEGRNVEEGCAYMMRLLRDAGFQRVDRMPTDGVPGVSKIGMKTAARLLNAYGSLEAVVAGAGILKTPLGERLRAEREILQVSRQLVELKLDVRLGVTWNMLAYESD